MTKLKSNNVACVLVVFFLAFPSFLFAKNKNSLEGYSNCVLNEHLISCENKNQLKLLDIVGYEYVDIINKKTLENLKIRYTASTHPHYYDVFYKYIRENWVLSELSRVTYTTNKEKIDTIIKCKAVVNINIKKIDEMFFVDDVDELLNCKEEVNKFSLEKKGDIYAKSAIESLNNETIFSFTEYESKEHSELFIHVGEVKYQGNNIKMGEFFPTLNHGMEVLKPFFLNVDNDDDFEIIVVTKSNIRPNQALFHEGNFYDVYVFDDFNHLKSNQLIHLKEYESLFENFSLDGRFDTRERESPLVNSNDELDIAFIKKILNSYNKHLHYKISGKSYLYWYMDEPTKMYLIKGDIVTLLDEKTDDSGQKWHFINYKGKKDLNMWIKSEAVDVEPVQDPIEKPEPIEQSASGSISLTLLASLLGLLAWRTS